MLHNWVTTRTGRTLHLLRDGTAACRSLPSISRTAWEATGNENLDLGRKFCPVCVSLITEYRQAYDAFGNAGVEAEERAPEDMGLEE